MVVGAGLPGCAKRLLGGPALQQAWGLPCARCRVYRQLSTAVVPAKENVAFREIKDKIRWGFSLKDPEKPRLIHKESSVASRKTLKAQDAVYRLLEIRALIRKVVQTLDAMTDNVVENTRRCEKYTVYPSFFSRKYKAARALPVYPSTWSAPTLTSYVQNLTKYHYVDTSRRISDSVGLVSVVLTDILRNSNPWTSQYLSTEAFNHGIRYFVGVADMNSAHQLLDEMQVAGIQPSRETFHYFLWSRAKSVKKNPIPMGRSPSPLVKLLDLLEQMKSRSLYASNETWNLILQAMPMGFGKSFLVEEMERRNVPLNDRSLSICLETLHDKLGPEATLRFAMDLTESRQFTVSTLNTVLAPLLKHKLPNNENVRRAFQFAVHCWEKLGIKPTTSTLNTFLQNFALRRHMDWQLGLCAYFSREHQVTLNNVSCQHILQAALLLNDNERKYEMLGMSIHQAEKHTLTPASRSKIRGAFRKAEASGHTISNPGDGMWYYLLDSLNWSKSLGPPDYASEPEMAKAAHTMGMLRSLPCVPNKVVGTAETTAFTAPPPIPNAGGPEMQHEYQELLQSPRSAYLRELNSYRVK